MRVADYRTPSVGIDSVEHEARLLRLWETAPGLKGFFGSVDHKQIGIRYIVTAFVLLAIGWHRSSDHARPTRYARWYVADTGAIQPTVLDARDDDDLPVRLADTVRLFELSMAAAVGQPRYGLSPLKRFRLLGIPGERRLHVCRLSHRKRPQ